MVHARPGETALIPVIVVSILSVSRLFFRLQLVYRVEQSLFSFFYFDFNDYIWRIFIWCFILWLNWQRGENIPIRKSVSVSRRFWVKDIMLGVWLCSSDIYLELWRLWEDDLITHVFSEQSPRLLQAACKPFIALRNVTNNINRKSSSCNIVLDLDLHATWKPSNPGCINMSMSEKNRCKSPDQEHAHGCNYCNKHKYYDKRTLTLN